MSKWSEKLADYCVQTGIVSNEHVRWFIYGIEKRVSAICTTIPFVLLALFMTTPGCALSLFVTLFLLRRRMSGYHAKSIFACFCTSLIIETTVLAVLYPLLQLELIVCIVGICTILIFALAPFNHPNMHFTKDELSVCKVIVRVCTVVLSFTAVLVYLSEWKEISRGITLGMVIATILLCIPYILEWRNNNG